MNAFQAKKFIKDKKRFAINVYYDDDDVDWVIYSYDSPTYEIVYMKKTSNFLVRHMIKEEPITSFETIEEAFSFYVLKYV